MIGKLINVTNFNQQQAIKFIAIKCTECDIYGKCTIEDQKICSDKTDYLLEKIRREEEQRKSKDCANVSNKGIYVKYTYEKTKGELNGQSTETLGANTAEKEKGS